MRCILFLCSYFPLWLIFAVLLFEKHTAIAIVIVAIGLSSLIITWGYIRWAQGNLAPSGEKLCDFSRRDTEVMSYIASYLVPFVTFALDTWQQVTALVIFLLVLLTVYVHSNMIYINPMLNLFGYHLYEVEIEHSEHPYYYIARRRLIRGEKIQFVRVSDDILLEQ